MKIFIIPLTYSSNLYIAILLVFVKKKKKEINICRDINNSIAIFDRGSEIGTSLVKQREHQDLFVQIFYTLRYFVGKITRYAIRQLECH